MEELLKNYIRFIEEEIDMDKKIDPDKKIKDQFDAILDETDFRLATIKFEMDVFIDIPKTDKNYELTMTELCTKIDELPRIKKSSVPAFLKKKKAEIAKITQEMAASLSSMFNL